ncbi:hypothetical protein BaRGS_00031884 [Batillaria attramentaria]|uniref:C2H2-type domain-containing protein n=1 Tax=Batillaria attramentaria TaxID=370345 RepID=A0ABD0JQ81_9CAEN
MTHRRERKRASSPLVSRFVDVGNNFDRWQEIGTTHGLRTNQEIASFLVQCYDDLWAGNQSAVHCYHCRSTLSLACGKCGWSQSNPEGRTTLFDDGLKKELAAVVDSLEKAENDSDRDRRSNRSAAKSGGRDRGQKRSSRQKSRRLAWPDPDDEDLPTFSQCQDDVGGQSDDAKSDHAEKGNTHNEDHSEEFTHTLHQMRPQSSCRRFGCLECGITFASASHLIVH